MTDGILAQRPVHALLADGSTVCIRPVAPDDHEPLQEFCERMSPENLRLRFFVASPRSAVMAADRACTTTRPGHRALIAETPGHVIGLAEYYAGGDGDEAEMSIAVADRLHHRGVGTLLVEHLVSAARGEGITTFTVHALSENREVLRLFADLGLRTARHFEGPEVHCTVRLDEDDTYLSAVEERGRAADVASLEPLLRPEAVAVVGAGRTPGSVGRAILHHLRSGGFIRRLFAVNPHASSILGVPCRPSVIALPVTPDLVVVAVPAAAAVQATAEECGNAGVRALLVVTAGLDHAQAQALLDACRTHGMRLVGPNCLGIANTDPQLRLDATFAADHPRPGTAGVAVQSGDVGIPLLDGLSRLGIGVSSFASLGDKHDLSSNDMLQWWKSDGRTDLALLHLESFGNPRAFSRTTRRVTRRMPVLTVDAGRTEAGRRAAASHTAAAATRTMTRQALFTQAGITATRSVRELLETAALMYSQPLPGGTRIAIVTNAGGAGVLAADACAEAGLALPPLTSEVIEDLHAVLPRGAVGDNPVDTAAAASEDQLRYCLHRLLRSPDIDAILVALVPTAVAATGDDLFRALTDGPAHRTRPVVAVRLEQDLPVKLLPASDDGSIPSYGEPQAAAGALAHAARRASWLARPVGTVPDLDGVDTRHAHEIADTYLTSHPDGGWLEPRTCADLLTCYGIPQLPWAWAASENDAVLAADRLCGSDGRVVMKAYWPGLLHKSEQHAVHLDLRDDARVRAAFQDFEKRFNGRMTGVVVQPFAARGTELFTGVIQDEVFGPLVQFGLGGTTTDVLAVRAARLAPLTDHDVHDLIMASRSAPVGSARRRARRSGRPGTTAIAGIPHGERPAAALGGRLRPRPCGPGRSHRTRRTRTHTVAQAPGPVSAPPSLRRERT